MGEELMRPTLSLFVLVLLGSISCDNAQLVHREIGPGGAWGGTNWDGGHGGAGGAGGEAGAGGAGAVGGGGNPGGGAGGVDCEDYDPDRDEHGYLSVSVDFLTNYGELRFFAEGCEIEAVDLQSECEGGADYFVRVPVGMTELVVESENGYRWRELVEGEPTECGHLDVELNRTVSFLFGVAVGPDEPRIQFPLEVTVDGEVVGSLSKVYNEDEIFDEGRIGGNALFYAVDEGMLWLGPFNDAPHDVGVDFGLGDGSMVWTVGPEGVIVEGQLFMVVAYDS